MTLASIGIISGAYGSAERWYCGWKLTPTKATTMGVITKECDWYCLWAVRGTLLFHFRSAWFAISDHFLLQHRIDFGIWCTRAHACMYRRSTRTRTFFSSYTASHIAAVLSYVDVMLATFGHKTDKQSHSCPFTPVLATSIDFRRTPSYHRMRWNNT